MFFAGTDKWNSWSRRLGALLQVAMVCLLAPRAAAQDAVTDLEYKVKAGYLFNFAKFVDWPPGSFPDADSPFIIAVIDKGEVIPILEKVLANKTVHGRTVLVRQVTAEAIPRDAHILLVTRAAGVTPESVRNALGNAPTLLVGETEQFAERGGVIGFVRENESVRLTLCLEHASENQLKISARLASVARSVRSKLTN
ncbi:MAG TPA: hypothetical protein DCY13_15350 [Verrucomicrobiales bacterium]|nr:hypothetical protein [Verrucomicrobiales bacterium]